MANNTGTFFNINDNDGIPLVGVSTDGKVMINHLYGNCLIGSTSVTGTAAQPLQVTGGAYVSGNIGIGTTLPTSKLQVQGDGRFTGVITATSFTGSLTGTASTANNVSSTININTSGIITATSFTGSLTGTASTANNVSSTININTSGIITATSFTGSLTGTASTANNVSSTININTSGIITATGGFNIGIQSGGTNITTGVITAINFIGSGNTFSYNSTTKVVDVTISGSGSGISSVSISTNTTNQAQYIPYITSFGNTTGFGATTLLVYNPSTGNLGIGTTNPTVKLQVVGNTLITGITTSSEFVGGGSDLINLSGTHLVSYASASDISNSALSIAGISTYSQVGILTGSLAGTSDKFGSSVATSSDGKTIIVGASADEIGGTNTGVVYVYDRVGNSFNQVAILTGSLATNTTDLFGSSVATSADGKTIIVGAYNDEIGATTSTGVVYVFDRVGNSFNQVGILTGSLANLSGDNFGISVATSADGKTIIVGAYNDEIGATTGTGVVYVYDRVGSSFNQVGILTGSLAVDATDNFGNSVATSSDGKTIIVGASFDEIGATTETGVVYVYDRVGSSFNQVGILTGSLAVNTSDNFGNSVATSADGKTIIVGASFDEIGANNSGVVYVFDRVGNLFNQVGILSGSLAVNTSDNFGNSVATSADGKTIIVGAPNDELSGIAGYGVVYVFNRQGNSFNQVGILTGSLAVDSGDAFGNSVATSADGKTIVVGASDDEIGATTGTGVVYVFDQTRETYVYSGPTGNIGIGTTRPTSRLSVVGDGNFTGIITATGGFVGGLTGTASTATTALGFSTTASINTTGIITATGGFVGGLTGTASTATTALGFSTTASINTTGIITASSFVGGLTGTASTSAAGGAPLKIGAGTTILTTPEAGAIEYDGSYLYQTPNSTSGRAYVPPVYSFRLTANGANIGATIADFFATPSSLSLEASSVYKITYFAYFTKNTAGTATWTHTFSSAPTIFTSSLTYSPVTGIANGTQTNLLSYSGGQATASMAHAATASLTTGVNHFSRFELIAVTNAATNWRLRLTQSAGTATPLAGSFYTIEKVGPSTGTFVA